MGSMISQFLAGAKNEEEVSLLKDHVNSSLVFIIDEKVQQSTSTCTSTVTQCPLQHVHVSDKEMVTFKSTYQSQKGWCNVACTLIN